MKIRIILLVLALAAPAWGQTEINYTVRLVDQPIIDINNHGDLITDAGVNIEPVLILAKGARRNVAVTITCPGAPVGNTVPLSINNRQEVSGYCFQPGIGDVGFIRHANGDYTFVQVPGAAFTFNLGINDHGHVVGQYWQNSGSFANYHGFLWDGKTYRTIDFPIPDGNTALLGITNSGIIIGAYFTWTQTSGPSEWTAFVWDNGTFTPLVNAFSLGTWSYPVKINNDGQILAKFDLSPDGFDGGPSEPVNAAVLFLHDDDRFFKIVLPTFADDGDRVNFDVNSINDKGQLAGIHRRFDCTGPFTCVIITKGFIATPRIERAKR